MSYLWRYRCTGCDHDFCSAHAKDLWYDSDEEDEDNLELEFAGLPLFLLSAVQLKVQGLTFMVHCPASPTISSFGNVSAAATPRTPSADSTQGTPASSKTGKAMTPADVAAQNKASAQRTPDIKAQASATSSSVGSAASSRTATTAAAKRAPKLMCVECYAPRRIAQHEVAGPYRAKPSLRGARY